MTIDSLLTGVLLFLNNRFIPVLIAVAFLIFIINAIRYFILQSNTNEGRQKAGRLALWGILGFVVMVSIWGIVNLFVSSLKINTNDPLAPDYVKQNRF